MQEIASFDCYGATFRFEPPVRADDGVVLDSLGKIAAAAAGYNPAAQARYAALVDRQLSEYVNTVWQITGAPAAPEQIASVLQTAFKTHTLSVVQ